MLCKTLPGGAVLLHTRQEVYFGLNAVGLRIWELLPPSCATLADLCAELHREHPEVDLRTIRADATELLDRFVEYGLAVRADPETES